MRVEDIISQYAEEHNLIYAICDGAPLEYDESICDIPFFHGTTESRINPSLLLPEVKSIIVLGVSYNKKIDVTADGLIRGRFSLNSIGEDYHLTLRHELQVLADRLGEHSYLIHVDTGTLFERGFALKAGLGVIGRSGNLISPQFGSIFNIGLLLTSLDIPAFSPTPPGYDPCGNCRRCIDACPSHAISKSSDTFNYNRCISYLTQKKGELSEDERLLIAQSKSLYGCDICQLACPCNKNVPTTCAVANLDEVMPTCSSFEVLTNRSFREKYGDTAIGWRGLGVIRRNARIISEYHKEDPLR